MDPGELAVLAARAAAGSREALDAVLTAVLEEGLARRTIRRLVIDEADVADVEQDALIRIAESIAAFRGDARFTTWLHRVARNTAIDHLRRRRDAVPLEPEQMAPSERISSLIATRATLEAALAALPDAYREPVMMRDVAQLPYAEIAERLGLNLNTVRTRIARGRALVAATLVARGG